MTLILGGVCNDGIIVGSDRAESSESRIDMVSKIYHLKNGSLFAFSGDLGISQKVMSAINNISDHLVDEPYLSQVESIENITKDLNKRYHELDVSSDFFLTMTDDSEKPVLMFFDSDGSSLMINQFDTLGSGSQLGMFFLRQLYEPNLSSEELAQIFSFIIQTVSESGVNQYVQVSKKFPPEVYIINSLNGHKPYKFENDFTYDINSDKIKSLNNFINNLFHTETIQIETVKRYF